MHNRRGFFGLIAAAFAGAAVAPAVVKAPVTGPGLAAAAQTGNLAPPGISIRYRTTYDAGENVWLTRMEVLSYSQWEGAVIERAIEPPFMFRADRIIDTWPETATEQALRQHREQLMAVMQQAQLMPHPPYIGPRYFEPDSLVSIVG